MKTFKRVSAVVLSLLALSLVVMLVMVAPGYKAARAEYVESYELIQIADGTVAYDDTGSTTGFEVSEHGSVVIQVISDASSPTGTLTVTPQYALVTGVPCSDVTDWFDGVDYVAYSSAPQYHILQHVPINYTTNTTDSLPFTGITMLISATVNTTDSLALAGVTPVISYTTNTTDSLALTGVTSLISVTTHTTDSLALTGVTPQLASSTNYTDSLAWTSTGSTTITGSAPYVVSTTYAYGDPATTLTGSIPYALSSAYTYRDPVATLTGSIPYALSSAYTYGDPLATLTGSIPYALSSAYTYGDPVATFTGSIPYVISTAYTYGDPVVTTHTISAAAGYTAVNQSMSVTGDTSGGRQFTTYGRCMRIQLSVSYGTITPTIYVMVRDTGE